MKLPFLFLDTQQFQAPSRGEGGREGGRRAPQKGAGEKEEARAAPMEASAIGILDISAMFYSLATSAVQPGVFIHPPNSFGRRQVTNSVRHTLLRSWVLQWCNDCKVSLTSVGLLGFTRCFKSVSQNPAPA